jgi:processive 1,2-diacylglycerol beta-glucosyltransferase
VRVLIASLPIGTGHDSAARAVTQALVARGATVQRSRHLEVHTRLTRSAYYQALRFVPKPYDLAFHRSHDGWRPAWAANRHRWRRLSPVLADVAASFHPDWVIATHPFALSAWAGVADRTFGVVGVLTDLSVHRFWYEPDADAYAVWLPGMRQDLVRWGLPEDRIWVTGIPIRPEFSSVRPRFEGPLVVMGGGLGMGPIERTVMRLRALDRPLRVVCGKNERLFDRLERRFRSDQVTVYGYVDNLPAVLDGAALVVSKPGGLTVAETAASGIPLLISHHLPGQECVNLSRLRRLGLAVASEHDLLTAARTLLRRNRWDEQVHRQRHLGRADAARALAAALFAKSEASAGQALPLP